MAEADAVVVGSGVNGLVAAAELALAGWSVVLVERNHDIGGFIATEERTLPGYLHDTYSSWHPLFVSGPAFASLGEQLRRHGLEYRNTDEWVTASVADDGRVTPAHRDPERTAAGFAHEADGAAYLAGLGRLGDHIESIGGLMSSELRSPALLGRAWAESPVTSSPPRSPDGHDSLALPASHPNARPAGSRRAMISGWRDRLYSRNPEARKRSESHAYRDQ